MDTWKQSLDSGIVIPACPLALQDDGTWSEQYQRAVLRYYLHAGAGGLAVGVHTTQFEIREAQHGLYRPLLTFASEVLQTEALRSEFVRVAGICGPSRQAVQEAELAADLNFHCGLVSLSVLKEADDAALVRHCREVSQVLPVFGFYLQPAVGGRRLSYEFWRRFCEIDNVVAIKIAAFNRYQTWDVVRAVIESGRDDIALYTGNDDNIIADLLTPFTYGQVTRRIVGGLLGQWAVWTSAAVDLLNHVRAVREQPSIPRELLSQNVQLTDANAAIFDAANSFAGCVPGINEVLRRSGLLPSARCLNTAEVLSPGQAEQISRVAEMYPHLTDDDFIAEHLQAWLN